MSLLSHKMLNLKVSRDIQLTKILQNMGVLSAGFSDKANKGLSKQVTDQDKIKSEEFRKVFSYVQERGRQLIVYKSADRFLIYADPNHNSVTNQRECSSEITNTIDCSTETGNPVQAVETSEALPKDNGLSKMVVVDADKSVPSDISTLTSSGSRIKRPGTNSSDDLSSAIIPLSLHRGDVHILKVIQDLNNIRALDFIEKSLVVAQERGLKLYRVLEHHRAHPEVLQEWVRRQALLLDAIQDKTAVWWCEAKSAVSGQTKGPDKQTPKTDKPTLSNHLERLKTIIEGLIATYKEKIEAKKKSDSKENK